MKKFVVVLLVILALLSAALLVGTKIYIPDTKADVVAYAAEIAEGDQEEIAEGEVSETTDEEAKITDEEVGEIEETSGEKDGEVVEETETVVEEAETSNEETEAVVEEAEVIVEEKPQMTLTAFAYRLVKLDELEEPIANIIHYSTVGVLAASMFFLGFILAKPGRKGAKKGKKGKNDAGFTPVVKETQKIQF